MRKSTGYQRHSAAEDTPPENLAQYCIAQVFPIRFAELAEICLGRWGNFMTLQFKREEYVERVQAARKIMVDRNLDALLIFAQESHYYLTGYDTSGYVFFQCLVVTCDVTPLTLLTRRPDLEQARQTSIIEDIRIWYDADGKDPTEDLLPILEEKGLQNSRIGVELDSFGLSARNHMRLSARLEGWATLLDGSEVVRSLRSVKSAHELEYVRRSAQLADASLLAMLETAGPGVFEGDIAAAGMSPILSGGGDIPPSGPVLGSGERALLIRGSTGYRNLDATDQLTIEFAASYRRYTACLMRTVAVGRGNDRQREMFDVTAEALGAMTSAARSGRPLGEIDAAHREVFDRTGFGHARMSACGYSLGATYRPTWMDVPPMLYLGNPMLAAPGMVLFLHAILIDRDAGLAMSLGHTIIVQDGDPEILSRLEPDYTICN